MVAMVAVLFVSQSQVAPQGCLAVETIATLAEGYRMTLRNDCQETVTAYAISIKGLASNGKSFSMEYVEDFWPSIGLPSQLSESSYGDRGAIGGIRRAQRRTIEQQAAFRGVDVQGASLSATTDAVVLAYGKGAGNPRFIASTLRKRTASIAEYSFWRDELEKAAPSQTVSRTLQSLLREVTSSNRFTQIADPDARAGSLSTLIDIRSFLRQMVQRAETGPVEALSLTKAYFDAKASLILTASIAIAQEK